MTTMAPLRRDITKGLERLGGRIDANGDTRLTAATLSKVLRLKDATPGAVWGMIGRMEADGSIVRDMAGTRSTTAIELTSTNGDVVKKPKARRAKKAAPRKRTARKSAPRKRTAAATTRTRRVTVRADVLPPAYGAQLRVCGLSETGDGSVRMALTDGTMTWFARLDP